MGAAKEGKQPIQIEWLVRDPQGKKLGTVSQRNEIPEGSLDGSWGKTAEQAAGAAAQGILKLLPQKSGYFRQQLRARARVGGCSTRPNRLQRGCVLARRRRHCERSAR